jgi:hypothetical protein
MSRLSGVVMGARRAKINRRNGQAAIIDTGVWLPIRSTRHLAC